MQTKWVRVRHNRTGHETNISERVVETYRRRGWEPADELDGQHDEHEHTATPPGVDGTSSSDDSKEIEQ